ncbi:VQ motif-containing protein 1-like [Pyrus x bretschneideri]|uniref:VQ motif-containing protein 1-like n=1 Tax=Pyrus x bretschneideri TaxID=225117 RepID=UPI00051193B7|nr:VQ motif-containing protein 1-like [Pyrus x bretschneideri]
MSSVGRNQCVKVVIINTKYVETDAMSFKDVVQRLTGKDSRVAYEVQEPITESPQYSLKEGANIGRTGNNVLESSNTSIASTMSRSNSSVLMRNISFKEFERLFREMPPMEEFLADKYIL